MLFPVELALNRVRSYLRRIPKKFTPWIHTPCDGRPLPRKVFVNGEHFDGVWYADLRKGFIRQHHNPPRVNRRKERVRWRKRWGEIVIQYDDGQIE